MGERGGKKKSVVLEPKVRERKKATASTNDEIPEDLIEKRRSSRHLFTVFSEVFIKDRPENKMVGYPASKSPNTALTLIFGSFQDI